MAADIIHVLHWGKVLCDFSQGLPRDWPSGHKWVGMEEGEKATCPKCKSLVDNKVVSIKDG